MHIMLLDMDGVLVDPKGYHNAFQKTVKAWGSALGFKEVTLADDTIAHFEAVGLTSEWESASVCVALMLRERWNVDPVFELPESSGSNDPADLDFDTSTWDDFLAQLDGHDRRVKLYEKVENQLVDGLTNEDHISTLQAMMRNARYIHRSPIHRTQQEFVLGSDQMRALYGIDPLLNAPSTLLSDDKPAFSDATRSRLTQWVKEPDQKAVAFTNRPCTPPKGHFDTPEAEMGLRAVGLNDLLVVGSGTMGWLSEREGLPLFTYLKPSPVHALTAMLHAAGLSTKEALQTAHVLDQGKRVDSELFNLKDARVDVFEDSTNGLESARLAKQKLSDIGIPIELHLYGIAVNETKRRSLGNFDVRIYANLDDALSTVPSFSNS